MPVALGGNNESFSWWAVLEDTSDAPNIRYVFDVAEFFKISTLYYPTDVPKYTSPAFDFFRGVKQGKAANTAKLN